MNNQKTTKKQQKKKQEEWIADVQPVRARERCVRAKIQNISDSPLCNEFKDKEKEENFSNLLLFFTLPFASQGHVAAPNLRVFIYAILLGSDQQTRQSAFVVG